MKKAKIMLTVIGISAILGALMAFKAKRFNFTTYCTTTNWLPGAICSSKAIQIDFVANPAATLGYYTTTTVNCPTNAICTSTGITRANVN